MMLIQERFIVCTLLWGVYSEEKATLREYIKKSVGGNLDFDRKAKKFIVNTDTQLRLLLYGIQQRFYMPPLEDEAQVAISSTGISNVL